MNPYPDSALAWYDDFDVYALPRLRLFPAAATLGNLDLHRAAKKLELDILHDPCGIAPFLARRPPYKRVVTVHDAIPFIYPKTQPVLTRAVYHTLVRAAEKTADAVITVSRRTAHDLQTHVGLSAAKLHVTPSGVSQPPASTADARRASLAELTFERPISFMWARCIPVKT